MAEQLHRGDVGVAVDDAAGHHRARIRLGLRDLAEARNVVAQHGAVEQQPDEERNGQPPVIGRGKDHGADEIHRDENHHVEQLHHHFAHGERGLQQLGGDAAGELVLKIAHRLAQHIAVAHPADPMREVPEQGLVDDQAVERDQPEQDDEKRKHAQKRAGFLREEGFRVGIAQPVDDASEEAVDENLRSGDGGRKARHRQQPAFGALGIIQAERQQALGRLLRFGRRIRIEAAFKPAQHNNTQQMKWTQSLTRKSAAGLLRAGATGSSHCCLVWRYGSGTDRSSRSEYKKIRRSACHRRATVH